GALLRRWWVAGFDLLRKRWVSGWLLHCQRNTGWLRFHIGGPPDRKLLFSTDRMRFAVKRGFERMPGERGTLDAHREFSHPGKHGQFAQLGLAIAVVPRQ